MKICYVGNANNIHTRRWISPFVERGDEVHLLSTRAVEAPLSGLAALVDLTAVTDLRKVRWPYWAWRTARYLRRVQPEILHALQVQAAGWVAAMAGYRPLVVSGWGSDLLVEPHRSRLRRHLVQGVLGRCDRLTVPSTAMARAAEALGFPGRRLRLVPWGVDTAVFRPQPDDRIDSRQRLGLPVRAPVILCPRRIVANFNLDTLLVATAGLLARFPDLRLVLIRFRPDRSYLAKLEQTIARSDLQGRVTWLAPQEAEAEMATLYRLADAVVSIPSSEGYGSSVYEALSCGAPTLISDVPAFAGELIDGLHTVKVPVRDVVATRDGLARLLADQELRRTLMENGPRSCRHRGERVRVERAAALYDELLEERR